MLKKIFVSYNLLVALFSIIAGIVSIYNLGTLIDNTLPAFLEAYNSYFIIMYLSLGLQFLIGIMLFANSLYLGFSKTLRIRHQVLTLLLSGIVIISPVILNIINRTLMPNL